MYQQGTMHYFKFTWTHTSIICKLDAIRVSLILTVLCHLLLAPTWLLAVCAHAVGLCPWHQDLLTETPHLLVCLWACWKHQGIVIDSGPWVSVGLWQQPHTLICWLPWWSWDPWPVPSWIQGLESAFQLQGGILHWTFLWSWGYIPGAQPCLGPSVVDCSTLWMLCLGWSSVAGWCLQVLLRFAIAPVSSRNPAYLPWTHSLALWVGRVVCHIFNSGKLVDVWVGIPVMSTPYVVSTIFYLINGWSVHWALGIKVVLAPEMPVFWKFLTFRKITCPRSIPDFQGFYLFPKQKGKTSKNMLDYGKVYMAWPMWCHTCAGLYQRRLSSSVVSGQSKSVKALWVNHGAKESPPFPQFGPISFLNGKCACCLNPTVRSIRLVVSQKYLPVDVKVLNPEFSPPLCLYTDMTACDVGNRIVVKQAAVPQEGTRAHLVNNSLHGDLVL